MFTIFEIENEFFGGIVILFDNFWFLKTCSGIVIIWKTKRIHLAKKKSYFKTSILKKKLSDIFKIRIGYVLKATETWTLVSRKYSENSLLLNLALTYSFTHHAHPPNTWTHPSKLLTPVQTPAYQQTPLHTRLHLCPMHMPTNTSTYQLMHLT